MRFLYLTEKGETYGSEEGTSGHRFSAWSNIEAKLKQALVDLKNLENPPTAGAVNTFANKKAFFEKVAVQRSPETQAAIRAARKEVDRLHEWLRKEGVTPLPDGTIESGNIQPLVVVYDRTAQEQGATKIHFSGGKLYTDAAFQKPLDTRKMVTHFSGPGRAIFVMSKEGNIHVDSHVVGHRHHSSLLAGQPVACAGELEVVAGTLKWLSNKSGHYIPNPDHLLQILHILQKKNVPLTFGLTVIGAGPTKTYGTVAEFFQALELDEQPDYELGKLLQYSDYLTDQILGPNNWRWRFPNEKPGVYDKTSGAMIPHKTVRGWLKQKGYAGTINMKSGRLR